MKESAAYRDKLFALRIAYAAFNRADMDGAVAALDPQIEWVESRWNFPVVARTTGVTRRRDIWRNHARLERK